MIKNSSQLSEKEIEERDKKIQNNPLTKQKLLMVIKGLEGIYSDEQIGIASGYFLKKGNPIGFLIFLKNRNSRRISFLK